MSVAVGRGPRLAGAVVGGALVAAYLLAWRWAETCESTAALGCLDRGVVVLAVGLPALYLLWAALWRALRLPLPWVGPLAVALVVTVLAVTTQAVDVPLAVWPFVVVAASYWLLTQAGPRESSA